MTRGAGADQVKVQATASILVSTVAGFTDRVSSREGSLSQDLGRVLASFPMCTGHFRVAGSLDAVTRKNAIPWSTLDPTVSSHDDVLLRHG